MSAPTTESAEEFAERTTRASGVPIKVEDPATLDQIAAIFQSVIVTTDPAHRTRREAS